MRFAPTVITALCAFACATAIAADDRTLPDAAKLKSMEARFAPVEVRVDVADLPAEERVALVRLIEASQYIDALFMRQRWPGNESTLLQLLADETPAGRARLSYFVLNKGPGRSSTRTRCSCRAPRRSRRAATSILPARRAKRSMAG